MLAFLLAPFYLLFNLYLFRRIMGWVRAWFPWFRKRKHWAVSAALYAFFALSFVLAFPLPAGRLKRALMLIGNYWLGVLLYLLLAVLLADGLRLLLVHGLKLRSLRSARMHRIAGCLCAAAILVTSVGGVINARVVRVTPYEITVNKSAGSMESMKVVLLADLHLGYNVGLAQMERMVARVNEQGADAVVIAGDIFDNAWEAVEEPEQKNPYYISGVKRQVYECLLDLTPGGQVIQIGEMGAKKPVMLAVYDGLILLLVTGFGLVLFRREDLK